MLTHKPELSTELEAWFNQFKSILKDVKRDSTLEWMHVRSHVYKRTLYVIFKADKLMVWKQEAMDRLQSLFSQDGEQYRFDPESGSIEFCIDTDPLHLLHNVNYRVQDFVDLIE